MHAPNASRATRWWDDIGGCPACGEPAGGFTRSDHGSCTRCGLEWTQDANVTVWHGRDPIGDERLLPAELIAGAQSKGRQRVMFLARRAAWKVIKGIGFPIRCLVQIRLEAFQRRSQVDKALAEDWRRHYLNGLDLAGDVLMFECSSRKAEKLGFAGLLGYRIAIQDIRRRAWWREHPRAWFQVAPMPGPRLALRDGVADIAFTDGAIFDSEPRHLEALFREYLRILKPGGYLVVWAGNSRSRSRAGSETRWHGRIHSLEDVRRAVRAAGFAEVDVSFEGYAPLFLPTIVNMTRAAFAPWAFKTYDYDSWLARWQRPEKRAYWLLRLIKSNMAVGLGAG